MKPPRYVLISPLLMLSLIALALGAGVAGCGAAGTSTSTPPAGATEAVSIKNYKFAPAQLTVARGTRVTFTNGDSTSHTASAEDLPALETGTIAPGKSKTVTLEQAGTFSYHCDFHPFMKGTITVTE